MFFHFTKNCDFPIHKQKGTFSWKMWRKKWPYSHSIIYKISQSEICVREDSCDRSSYPEVFSRKNVLKICSKFTGELLCRSVISIKLLCNFIDFALQHGCSFVNLLHIFRTPFPRNFSGWLLLLRIFKVQDISLTFPYFFLLQLFDTFIKMFL